MQRIFKTTTIAFEDGNLEIYPNENWDGIVVRFLDLSGKESYMNLSKAELDCVRLEMDKMMDYVMQFNNQEDN